MFHLLTLYSIIRPFDAFEIQVFENIMVNGAFAPLEFLKLYLNCFIDFFNVI